MGANSFGKFFTFTTYGQSHGSEMGVIIDGCPAGLVIDEDVITRDLQARRPGKRYGTSARGEKDLFSINSGVFEGVTTGAPIAIRIANADVRSQDYNNAKNLHRPGHASYTYFNKYGLDDYRGGGRASARETVCRVACGAIAQMLLRHFGIEVCASLENLQTSITSDWQESWNWPEICDTPFFSLDSKFTQEAQAHLENLVQRGESCGATVRGWATGVPCGLGDPIYEKLPALLGSAMLSIPAVKSFSIGAIDAAISLEGSSYRDEFMGKDTFASNRCGGVLGGISSGQTIYCSAQFKPTSSTKKSAVTHKKNTDPSAKVTLEHWSPTDNTRHDPCVAIRAVPVVRAMLAIVLADRLLANCCSSLSHLKKIY